MPNTTIGNDVYVEPKIYVADSLTTARSLAGPTATPSSAPSSGPFPAPPTDSGSASPTTGPFPLLCLIGSSAAFDAAIKWYAWDPTSTAADDGSTVLQPTIAGTALATGRWRAHA